MNSDQVELLDFPVFCIMKLQTTIRKSKLHKIFVVPKSRFRYSIRFSIFINRKNSIKY